MPCFHFLVCDNTINPALYPGAATQNLCPGTTLEGISFIH